MIPVLDRRPILIALAGPNGAGKSTFYDAHLAGAGLRYLNADAIALGLGIDAYKAADLAHSLRLEMLARKESFVFETVFSDPFGEKLDFLLSARDGGYTVVLIFIGLDAAATSQERVTMRVLQGGHDVPEDKILHRYGRVLNNLRRALPALDHVFVYDNSDLRHPHRLLLSQQDGTRHIHPPLPEWLQSVLPASPEDFRLH